MAINYLDSKRISALSSDFPTTTTTYDHIGDTNNAGLHAINTAGGHDGTKVGIKIIAGSSAIGTKIEYVSMSIRKWSGSTGNYVFQVIDGTDGTTVLASATSSASALTETPATVELQLDSVVTLSVNDRIVLSYPDGSGSNIVGIARNSTTTESGYNRSILGYSTTTWTDSTTNNIIMTFDSSPASISKPTNVQDNSILVEKDTGKRYWFTKGTAVTEETLDSTNGTASWNVSNGGSDITIDTGNNEIDITGTGQKSGYYDLGASISASAWTLRFKIASSGSPTGNPIFWLGMFDVNTIDSRGSTNVDGISVMMYTGGNYKLSMKNGTPMDSGGSQTDMSPTVSADTTTRYVEIVRDGSNAILTFYDSDTYTTSIGTVTVAITGSAFRYLCAISYWEGSGRTYSLSNVKFYNGATSVTPATWSRDEAPYNISGLYAWYDASDLTTITKTADRVSSWTNKEGTTARDLNQATGGSQPLWLSANKNGLDTIDFVGSRYIRTDSALTTISAAQLTIFIVLKIPANGVTINHSMSNVDTAGGNFHPFYKEDNNTIRVSNTSGGAYVIDSPPSALSWTYATISQNGTSGFVRTDGVLETTVPTSPTGTAKDFRGLSVGRYEEIAGSYWNEEIGEIIIYDRILTSTEIDTIESYLKSKWGL